MLSTERRQPGTSIAEPIPIWMAALIASEAGRRIRWEWLSGRAVYTNGGTDTEVIEPFGVPVQGGESISVTWLPGETAYTVELCGPNSFAS